MRFNTCLMMRRVGRTRPRQLDSQFQRAEEVTQKSFTKEKFQKELHYSVILGSNIVQMPLWKCLFNNQIDVYKFHTMLRGRRYQTKGSKSSFRFGKGANQKPRRAHAHLIKLRQVHGAELHVYTILPAPTGILNI